MLAAGVAGRAVPFVAVALNTTPIFATGTVSKIEDLKGKAVGIPVGGLRFVSGRVAVRDPRAKNYAPENFMALRFVKQLAESGFIKGLYPKG